MNKVGIYSVEVSILRRPVDSEASPIPTTVRYCDVCQRWGANHTTHVCRLNWHRRLSDLLVELAQEDRP